MRHSAHYRDVPLAPTDAVAAAASLIDRDYGSHGYRLGYAGLLPGSSSRYCEADHVFQVKASDGSRFLVVVDAYGNDHTPDSEHERMDIADALGFEVSSVLEAQ